MGCLPVGFMFLLGCIFPKKRNGPKKVKKQKIKKGKIVPTDVDNRSTAEEETIVETIYIPLELQPAMQEPRTREPEQEVLSRLKDEGILSSETLNETKHGKSFYISLDGNPYPSGKPRLLEPIQFQYDEKLVKTRLDHNMNTATKNRKNKLDAVTRRARLTSAKVRQAQVNEEQRRKDLKDKIDRKMEQAARNRLLSRGK